VSDTNRKSIARSLGEFVGHIYRGATADVQKENEPSNRVVSEHHESEQRDTARGSVTIRRTIIEEVDLPEENQ
jgi:hypothetical protein